MLKFLQWLTRKWPGINFLLILPFIELSFSLFNSPYHIRRYQWATFRLKVLYWCVAYTIESETP